MAMPDPKNLIGLAILLMLSGCGEPVPDPHWTGTVDADVDDLTGERTGLFHTYGPTAPFIAGPDTIPVTVGYWCRLEEEEAGEPLTALDGLFLKVSLQDTSLTQRTDEAFQQLQGNLGLLDIARMAVDGEVLPWSYDHRGFPGYWMLYGVPGFDPKEIGTVADASKLRETVREYFLGLEELLVRGVSVYDRFLNSSEIPEPGSGWPAAFDYATSHYRGRDTVAFELVQAVAFPMVGFDQAMDSVRFWCPVAQSHHEWNTARTLYLAALDSLRANHDARVTEAREEEQAAREARRKAARSSAAAQARVDSIVAVRVAVLRSPMGDGLPMFHQALTVAEHFARWTVENDIQVTTQQDVIRLCQEHYDDLPPSLGRLRAKHREKVEDAAQAAMPTVLKRLRIS